MADDQKRFTDHAYETWKEKYGFAPPWRKQTYILLSEAANLLAPDHVKRAWNYYLSINEDWTQGHPPRKFMEDLGRWSVGGQTLKVLNINGFKLSIEGWEELNDGRMKKQGDGVSFIIDPRRTPETFYAVKNGEFSHFTPLPPGTTQTLKRYQFKRKQARYGTARA